MDEMKHTAEEEERRRRAQMSGRPAIAGVPVRDDDIEPTVGLHWVAKLCRVMSGLLAVLMVLQIVNGVTSTVDISYGVLIAEALRLVIFAGLLWGAGDLADLFVKSHCDLRATRILLARLNYFVQHPPVPGDTASGDAGRGPRDDVH